MTINEKQNELIGELSRFKDPLDLYGRLISMGRDLPEMDPENRNEFTAIPGCQSHTWIHGRPEAGRLHLTGDSDSQITRGFIALLIHVYDEQSPADILTANLYLLEEIGLTTNLSPSRANGLALIVRAIRRLAETHA